MSSVAAQTHMTPEEYLAFERKATTKNEYLNGQIIAMSGASRVHNLITGNIFNGLYTQLIERECETYASDMRVKAPQTVSYTYPDVVVVCDESRFEDGAFDTLLNPIVLIEVLSPLTEVYDRGEKFAHYRQIDSLQEYVLVLQDRRISVEHYLRQGTQWLFTEFRAFEESLSLTSIECELPLRNIYRRVEFSEQPALLLNRT